MFDGGRRFSLESRRWRRKKGGKKWGGGIDTASFTYCGWCHFLSTIIGRQWLPEPWRMVTNTPTHTPLEGELAASLIHWILNCSNPLPPTHAPVRERERDSCARGKFSHSPIHGLLLLVLMLVLVLVLMLWPPCGPSLPGSDRHILTLSPGASGDPCWPGCSRTGADSEQEKKKKKRDFFIYYFCLWKEIGSGADPWAAFPSGPRFDKRPPQK